MADEQIVIGVMLEGMQQILTNLDRGKNAVNQFADTIQKNGRRIQMAGMQWNEAIGNWQQVGGKKAGDMISWNDAMERIRKSISGVASASSEGQSGVAKMVSAFSDLYKSAVTTDEELQKKPEDMDDVAEAGVNLEDVIRRVSRGAAILGQAFGVAGRVLGGVFGVIESVGRGLLNTAGAVGRFIGEISKFSIGYLFGRMVEKISEQLRNLSRDVVRTTSDFQLLEIRFKTIGARDIARNLGIPIKEAMGQATEQAQKLLYWVRQIAIETPFTAGKVAESLALANAYGLTTSEAMTLTGATMDYAAAMGLTEEHIYRIIYNFGQMREQGKLTGREFRDLAVSFVPVTDIMTELAAEAGITTEEMKKIALEGGVPVDKFFKKFVELVERDFKGSAKEMARTLAGVTNNIKDTFNLIVGLDILGPFGKTLASALDNMLQKLKSPEIQKAARVLGGVLNVSLYGVARAITQDLLPALGELAASFGITWEGADKFSQGIAQIGYGARAAVKIIAKLIRGIAKWVTDTFGAIQDNGYTYGYNLVSQFAKGMAAAIKAILWVIRQIALLIKDAFGPGSPPKIAKNIDKWGASMIKYFAAGASDESDDLAESIIDREQFQKDFRNYYANANPIADVVVDWAAQARAAVQPLIDRFGPDIMAGIASRFDVGNFEMFGNATSVITDFIRSMTKMDIPEIDIVPKILGSRKAIAESLEAVRTGGISVADAINRIVAAVGKAPLGFSEYISGLFDLDAATRNYEAASKLSEKTLDRARELIAQMSGEVRELGIAYVDSLGKLVRAQKETADAEEYLARITEHYDNILRDLKAQLTAVTEEYDEQLQLREIDAALATQLLTNQERERLEMLRKSILLKQQIRETEEARDLDIDAADDRVDAARVAEEAAEAEAEARQTALIEMAEAQRQYAEDQVAASKALIEMQVEQNNLIREQMDLLEQLAKSAAKGAEGGVDAEDLGDWGKSILDSLPTPEEVQRKINEIMAAARKKFDEWKEKMKTTIANAFGYESWDQMTKDFDAKIVQPINDAITNVETYWNEKIKPTFELIRLRFEPAISKLATAFDNLKKAADSVGINLPPFADFVTITLWLAADAVATNIERLAWGLQAIADVMKFFDSLDKQGFEGIKSLPDSILSGDVTKGAINFGDFLKELFGENQAEKEGASLGERLFGGLSDSISGGVNGQTLFQIGVEMLKKIREGWISKKETFTGPNGEVVSLLSGIGIAAGANGALVMPLVTAVTDKTDMIKVDWEATGKYVKDRAVVWWGETKTTVDGFVEDIRSFVETKGGEMKTNWEATQKDLEAKANTHWTTIHSFITTKSEEVRASVSEDTEEVRATWDEKWNKIKTLTTQIWNDPDGIVQTIISGAQKLIDKMKKDLNPAVDETHGFFDDLAAGIESAWLAMDELIEKIGNVISAVLAGDWAKVIELLAPFIGGSPSPLAVGLSYATKEMRRLENAMNSFSSNQMLGNRMMAPQRSSSINNSRTVTINVDANYAKTQSPVDIYYDISAALAASNL